ncbi:MAG TPA: hypothetical protein VE933_04005, partial [Chitinophagaceae bacterium]|nr:hypothetical protein [Chitinophagaceae bacterium]
MKIISTLVIVLAFTTTMAWSQEISSEEPVVVTGNCYPSKDSRVIMRCTATQMPTEPLLVIDGLPYEFNELKSLNPED